MQIMQPTGSGGELSRGRLARFRSAPATWLEALLEEEEDIDIDPPKPTQSLLSQLPQTNSLTSTPTTRTSTSYVDPGLFSSSGTTSRMGFLRQNSSPAEFLAQISSGSDGYFSNFGIPASYDYLSSSSADVSTSGKRPREKEEQNEQLQGLLDAEMEKLMEDSVPCRIRAKRGCATHPRSIAERVRRTRISDRIRKLQELVPNMDKQTNTADMLEEAVEYVKFLQKQIQELMEHQNKCICSAKN